MSRIEGLLKAYSEFVAQPWSTNLAGAEKVWFAVYDPTQERRLLLRIPDFETATRKTGHYWRHLDLSSSFARWMAKVKYRESYFEDPEAMDLALRNYGIAVTDEVKSVLAAPDSTANTAVAISGVGSLFGLARTSEVIEKVTAAIRGRLLVFFPGRFENSQYRLFDARDGWNYLAVPITAKNGD